MRSQWWYVFQALTVVFLFMINYLADRLLRGLYPSYSKGMRVVFWFLATVSILVYAFARSPIFREVGAGSALKYFLYTMIVWDIAIFCILLAWPLCWIASKATRQREQDPDRRAFIGKALGLASAASFAFAFGGVTSAETTLTVNRQRLALANLPLSLGELKVVQISDSHLGLFFSLRRWAEVLALVRAEKPDLLLLTGDIIDDLELLQPALAQLAELRPFIPSGIFACLGNHEYFRNVSVVRRAFAAASIPLLSNENRRLVKGTGEFYLLGADYPLTRNPAERSAQCSNYVEQAIYGVPKKAFSLLMAHHPDFITEGFHRDIALTIAGHTHGAQIGWGDRSLFEGAFSYTRGLYQQGSCYGFVSSGVGHWLPFRLACPPEIVSFTLTSGGDIG